MVENMTIKSSLMTKEDIAELLGVTPRSIYQSVKWSQISERVGGRYFFEKKKVRSLLQNEINEARDRIDHYENIIAHLDVAIKSENVKASGNKLVLKNGQWQSF